MTKRQSDEQLANPSVPLNEWAERPAAVTGEAARTLGRMLLDDSVPAAEIVTALRPGPPSLGQSGEESPILRFRVPEEDRSALRRLIETTHRKQSDLLREGLALVLERYDGVPAAAVPVQWEEGRVVVALTMEEFSLLRELTSRVEKYTPAGSGSSEPQSVTSTALR